MARDRELEYILSLKDEATAAYRKFTGEIEKGTINIQSLAKGAGVAIAGMFSIQAAAQFMSKAAEADAGIRALEQSMTNAGLSGELYKNMLMDQADALSAKVAVDDDEIMRLQSMIMAYTQNIEVTKRLVPVILDVTRATGMSSEAAAKMFARTQEGGEVLKKLGITIGETANDEERLARTIEEVTKKFGGQAEAFAQTDAGKIEAAKLAWDDFETSMGRLLNSTLVPMVPVLTNIANGVAGMVEEIRAINDGESLADWGDIMALSLYRAIGATDAYNAKIVDLSERQALWNDHLQRTAKETPPATTATKSFSEKLTALNDELKALDPSSAAYVNKLAQITKMQDQAALATERARMKARGNSGTTLMDVKFAMNFQPEIDKSIDASTTFFDYFNNRSQTMFGGEMVQNLGANLDASGKLASQFFTDFSEETAKMFGGGTDPQYLKNVQEQAEIANEIRLIALGEGKARELALVTEWETNAVAMAHENQTLITEITAIAAAERARIEKETSIQTFQDIAGFAQQAIGLYQQAVQQSSQTIINTLTTQRDAELKGIEKQRAASRRKYDEMLRDENLTAEQRAAIRQQAADDDAALMAQKEAAEDAYNARMADEKRRAFEKQKQAQVIASMINTAVEITKVLATPWMIPIVAGLGLAQTALIASQPTPSFHTGGAGFFNAPPSEETYVKIRGQERVQVYTPEQRDRMNNGGSITIINQFMAPVSDEQFVANAIVQRLRATGLPIEKAYMTTTNGSVVMQ